MRQPLLLLIGLLLLSGSVAATLGTVQLRDFELRGYVDPTRDQNLPYMTARPGVNVDLRQYDSTQLRDNLQRIASAGFIWLRQFVYWDEVEPKRGERDWSEWDAIFTELRAFRQLRPVLVLMNAPGWARPDHPTIATTASSPPAAFEDFAAFAGHVARRYGDVVDHYQIWDEPNLDEAWGMRPPRPAEYVALLEAGARAIRANDESAIIIAAALAPTSEINQRHISDIHYLNTMYQLGAANSMDIAAAKPYGFDSSPLDRRADESLLNFSRIVLLREVMLAHGDGGSPLWASQWGWNALPDDWTGDQSIWGSVSAGEQIRYVLQAFDRAHRELPWLGAMILHHWQPDAPPESAQWGFALIRPDGSAFDLLAAVENHAFPRRAQNGLYHPRNEYARYSGVWQFSPLGADIGWLETSDSQLEFDFYGRDLALLLREDDYVAFLYPRVDDQPANATPADSDGNAYVFLRSSSKAPERSLTPISRGLALDRHTLQANADRGWDRWALAGYAVSSGDLNEPYDRQIQMGALAIVLSALALMAGLATSPWRSWLPGIEKLASGLGATLHLALGGVTSLALLLALAWSWSAHRPLSLARDEVNIPLALLSSALLYWSPSLLLALMAAIVLFTLFYHRLETGLILTIFWAPFFLFPVELYRYAFPMVELMILLTALAAAFRYLVWLGGWLRGAGSGIRLGLGRLRGIDLALAGIAILACLSLLWSRRLDVALTELRSLIIEPLLFYLIFRALRPDRDALRRMLIALMSASLLVSAIGLVGYLSGEAYIEAEGGARRLVSVYGSPNNVGLLLGRALPFALAILLVIDARRDKFAAAIALLIMSLTILLTQSVGAIFLALPAGIIAVLIGRYRSRAALAIVAVGIVAALAFAALTQLSPRFANILDFSSGTNFLRLRLWESSLEIISDHPVTGLGLDQFLYLYSGEYVRPDAIWDPDLSHPHNVFLDFWTRLGIAGLALFLLIQAAFWKSLLPSLRSLRARDQLGFAMALGLAGSMAGLLSQSLIDNSVFVIDLAFIFMFQLALLLRLEETNAA